MAEERAAPHKLVELIAELRPLFEAIPDVGSEESQDIIEQRVESFEEQVEAIRGIWKQIWVTETYPDCGLYRLDSGTGATLSLLIEVLEDKTKALYGGDENQWVWIEATIDALEFTMTHPDIVSVFGSHSQHTGDMFTRGLWFVIPVPLKKKDLQALDSRAIAEQRTPHEQASIILSEALVG